MKYTSSKANRVPVFGKPSPGLVLTSALIGLAVVLMLTGCATSGKVIDIGDGKVFGQDPDKAKSLLASGLKIAAKYDPAIAPYAGLLMPYLGAEETTPEGFAAQYAYTAYDTNGVAFALDPTRGIGRETWYYRADTIPLKVKTTPVIPPEPPPAPTNSVIQEIDTVRSNIADVVDNPLTDL